MSDRKTLTRRTLIKRGLAGGVMLPAAMMFGTSRAFGEMPLVDEADPTAKALGYVHDASAVDTAKFPKRAGEEGAKQFCNNCSLYNAAEGASKGACAIFPGKLVKGAGWCNSWVPKA